jgi:hypothetical protein
LDRKEPVPDTDCPGVPLDETLLYSYVPALKRFGLAFNRRAERSNENSKARRNSEAKRGEMKCPNP